jgi:hypothetical protein
MNKALGIGSKVKITDGPNEGKEGYITRIDTDGSVEVRGTIEGGGYFTERQWDFQLEQIDPDKGIEPISYNERVCDNTCEVKSEPKKNDNPIKDSGQRTEFSTGAVRDMSSGKGDMLSMPWKALLRLSRHYENGARKYRRFNYMLGIPTSSFIDSAMRHLADYLSGEDSEDHLAACCFNVLGAMLMEAEHPELCDIPMREGKNTFPYFRDNNEGNPDADK